MTQQSKKGVGRNEEPKKKKKRRRHPRRRKTTTQHIMRKLHREENALRRWTWRRWLGSIMESTLMTGAIVLLIFIDLLSTTVNVMLEETDLLNPKYEHEGEALAMVTHRISLGVLCIFLGEQILHLVAHGSDFFTHHLYVLDLVVVCTSLVCETVLEEAAHESAKLLILTRLWKLVAFLFDIFLGFHELQELHELQQERSEREEREESRSSSSSSSSRGSMKQESSVKLD